jgi:hypothetical protein
MQVFSVFSTLLHQNFTETASKYPQKEVVKVVKTKVL